MPSITNCVASAARIKANTLDVACKICWGIYFVVKFAPIIKSKLTINAAIKACETVDDCSRQIIEIALKRNYSTIVIADHGNCDIMINPDGSPNTAHTTNMVPIILVENEVNKISNGVLGDIAPTILDIMDIKKPHLMSCKSLLK